MTRTEILNALARTNRAETYLEIGVQHGRNLDAIAVPRKVGVDPAATVPVTYPCTSDEFFARLDRHEISAPPDGFDLVFVDGSHLSEMVVRDVLNADRYLSRHGVIVMHDCSPPDPVAASRTTKGDTWCGDVWLAWVELRWRIAMSREMFVVDADLGVGVILPEQGVPVADTKPRWWRSPVDDEVPRQVRDEQGLPVIDYWHLNMNRQSWLNLMHPAYFSARFSP